jgi:hypothetical protein
MDSIGFLPEGAPCSGVNLSRAWTLSTLEMCD